MTAAGLPPLGAPRTPSGTSPARASPRSGEVVALRVWVSPCIARQPAAPPYCVLWAPPVPPPGALMVVMGPGRRNITAGGLGTRLPPAQHALASVGDTSLVLLSALLHPPQYQTRFLCSGRRAAANLPAPSCPRSSNYTRGWFDRAQTRHPPPHRHIGPHPTRISLSLALPKTLPQIEPEPPTSEETRCR